ncbi:GT2 family glycosyltransferase [Rhizobium sp. PP-WC-2G-219]|nr:GT2 family glycosyltransferase [Rhizobium sp. PP-CC-3A-592]TCL96686.1 GT2 family glycosyltransferase [Rhizobium sp. PP-WC-2G-219]
MIIDNLFIGLITFRRPKGLRRALEGIAALTFETTPPPITVIVVDNDRDGPMAGLIEEMRPSFPFPITYAVHPEPGIPFARNRVVAETKGADGVILFIDDDEYPEPEWADQLLAKYRATGAEAILGPVISEFETTPPQWVSEGGFFVPRRFADGGVVPFGNTANILIDLKVFKALGLQFDPRLRFTGGEDTLLGMMIHKKGGRMLWASKARVHELVPASRVSSRWLVSRKFREGNTYVLSEKLSGCSMIRQVSLFLSAVARVGGGGVLCLAALPFGTARRVKAISRTARGLGMLNAFAGRRYDEYKTIHGS